MNTIVQATMAPKSANRRAASEPPPWPVTLFSHGFRPFFLAAGVYAALALAAWLAWILIHAMGAAPAFMTIDEPPHLWHAHEMIFGFAAAAVGGFLLTAVPNWTGTDRLRGGPLALVFSLWLIGRCAMWITASLPPGLTAGLDLVFLPVLGVLLLRKFGARLKPQNLVFIVLVGILAAANAIYHLGRLDVMDDGMTTGAKLGLGTLVLLITIVGGRVVPGFTQNALTRRGIEDRLPVRNGVLDAAGNLLVALLFVAYVSDAPPLVAGAIALAGAVVNGVRLSLWRVSAVLREPIVWVLHLGYGWLVVGLALMAAALLADIGSDVAALHAFGTGAVGTMILAIMSRASLGHSGRPLIAPRPVVASYLLVSAAALLRAVGSTALPGLYNELMLAAGAAWIAAFVLFSIVYAPILVTPRQTPAA
ncbi:MAG: NnrS family protein [Methyloligellaceae bacterium]